MNNITPLNAAGTDVKRVTIKFVGGQRASETIALQPGNTAGDVLQELGLDHNFTISPDGSNTTFGRDETVYGEVEDGDVLFVTSVVDAGFCYVVA